MTSVLVIGSGGREHALAWKLSQSPRVSRLIVAPGNDGMPSQWERWFYSFSQPSLQERQAVFQKLAERARIEKIDLAVVGPDQPLADGIVDVLERNGILTVGPRAHAAQIEASKSFAKDMMRAADIPTARYWVAERADEARKILRSVPWGGPGQVGWVVKADGLALGKGVRVCDTLEDALRAVDDLTSSKVTPANGSASRVIIEEKLRGQEVSWLAFCDGERCALLEPARDYKRLLDQDQGPNTGGMGSISPVPNIPSGFEEKVRNEVFLPVLKKLKDLGTEFRGLLYAGLMVDFATGKFWVLEFNARFGDPETQVLLPRIQGDILPWFEAVAKGDLSCLPPSVPFIPEHAVCVVAAAGGYPGQPEVGKEIQILGENSSPSYFFAGVKREGSLLLTSGGRVLGALGKGASLEAARNQAYQNLKSVSFPGMQFRSDIGRSSL